MKKNKKKTTFSKGLLIQESILIWIITICFLGLAFLSIEKDYIGELPWFNTIVGCSWAAYGVSQACYYRKSAKENTQSGIVYDLAMKEKAEEEITDEEEAQG